MTRANDVRKDIDVTVITVFPNSGTLLYNRTYSMSPRSIARPSQQRSALSYALSFFVDFLKVHSPKNIFYTVWRAEVKDESSCNNTF